MSTPMETSSWKMIAWRKGSSIYLKAGSGDRVFDAAAEVEKTRESFLRMAFHRLVTRSNPCSCHMDEAELCLKVSRIQFGPHNLISLSESGARDVDGDEVRIFLKKCVTEKEHKVSFYNGHYFHLWAEAQLTNQSHVVIGKYDSQMTVQSIAAVHSSTTNMTTVMRKEMHQLSISAKVWDPDQACDFLNRFLTFVRKSLADDELLGDGRLLSFEYVTKTTKAIIPVLVTTMTPFETE